MYRIVVRADDDDTCFGLFTRNIDLNVAHRLSLDFELLRAWLVICRYERLLDVFGGS